MPTRLKTRGGYVLCAFLVSLLVIPIWGAVLWAIDGFGSGEGMNISLKSVIGMVASVGLPAAASAALCWPRKTKRTKTRMALAGVASVGLSFVLIALITGLGSSLTQGDFSPLVILSSAAIFTFMGSLLTLGIPYALGAAASLPFADKS